MEKKPNINQNVVVVDKVSKSVALFRLVCVSAIGVFLFFIPFSINGSKSSIFIDHSNTFIKKVAMPVLPYYIVILMIYGAVMPFVKKTWNKNGTEIVMSLFKALGAFIGILFLFKIGPDIVYAENMLPFIFNRLVMSLAIVIPIGGALLLLVTEYGLMDFVGVYARPFMRPIFKCPGRAAVGAAASFLGSYSLGLIITNKEYKEHKYSAKEATIIATGFSTVSAAFMVIVASNLDLMDHWNLYFWSCLVVTFAVTAVTIRLYPINKAKDTYYEDGEPLVEPTIENGYFNTAVFEGLKTATEAKPVLKNVLNGFISSMRVTSSILPSMMSIGLIGLLVAEHTPVFTYFGLIFRPITFLLGMPNGDVAATAVSVSIVEMLLPAADTFINSIDSVATKFIIGIVCVSEILFFSASIPCMLATEIPLKVKDLVIVWFLRVSFSLIFAAPIAYLFFGRV